MRPPPRTPTGQSNEARFARWVTQCILAMQRGNVPGLLTLQQNRPRRPVGSDREAILVQWFYDTIIRYRPREATGVLVSKTTKGVIHRAAN